MRPSQALCVVAALVAVGGGCLLSLPLDDLTRDEPSVPIADVAAESIIDGSIDATETSDSGNADSGVETLDAGRCANRVLDGDETDTDCGGSCAGCAAGRRCKEAGDCSSGNCSSGLCALCPTTMVRIPIGTQSYCIDSAEVTIAQYEAFVARVTPASVTFPAPCKWKNADASFAAAPKPTGASTTPVRNVDWCDAWAYCSHLNKRLCGAISPTLTAKPPAPFDKFDDPNVDQWRHACSYSASPAWPYGAAAESSRCATADRLGDAGTASVVPVRSLTTCTGVSPELTGLYDMSGNVSEWEDSCSGTAGRADNCRVRGGSFREKAVDAPCGAPTSRSRSDRHDWLGFRCCRF